MTSPRALIVERDAAPHVLAAARALGAAGWEVGLATAGARGPAHHCRWIGGVHPVAAPESGAEAFVEQVAEAVRAGAYDVVFGADDIDVLALSAGRDAIPCVVPHAAHADVLRAVDKLELARAAGRAGLGTPATRLATPEALEAAEPPVLVKARLHWTPGTATGRRHLLAARCETRADAVCQSRAIRASGGEPLLQDAVDGQLMALTLLVGHDGRVVAYGQQRSSRLSLRLTSSRAESLPAEPDLVRGASRLLADLRWFGLANLQFLRRHGGEPELIDLNGRFYGSLALMTAAGLNLPDLWGRLALGEPAPRLIVARPGARFQSLLEDLARARVERRGGLVRDVAGTLAAAPKAVHPHASLRDPGPGAALLASLVTGRIRRARGSFPGAAL